MSCCGELEHSLNDLLIDSVSVPFDFFTLWKEVTEKCSKILLWETFITGGDAAQNMCETVMDAYLLVYHLVSHPCSNTPVVKVDGYDIWEGQQIMAVFSLQGAVFEKHLINNVVEAFTRVEGGSIVQTYVRSWRSFLVAVVNIKTVFSSLLDKWALLGLEDTPLDRTEYIALKTWSGVILRPSVVTQLRKELRALLADERAGHDRPDFSFAVEIKDELSMLPDTKYYHTVVESDYISDLCTYCELKVHGMAKVDLFTYAKECLSLIEEEVTRAEKYLTSKTHAVDRLIETLVDDHINDFAYCKLSPWLSELGQREADEKIRTIFHLLWWSKAKGAVLIEGMFKDNVAQYTSTVLSGATRLGSEGSDACSALLVSFATMIRRYRSIVLTVFDYNGCMLEAMNNGLRCGLMSARGVNFKKLADRLAVYSNAALLSSDFTMLTLEDVISVYYFLPDAENSAKDVFLVSYQRFLAKRLLLHQFDAAKEQLSMEQLVQIKQSPILFCCRSMLKAATRQSICVGTSFVHGVKVRPALLSRGIWPSFPFTLKTSGISPCVMRQVECAQSICMQKRHGQRIEFSVPYSSAVVRMRKPSNSSATVESVLLKVSFLQMCIIDNFNTKQEWKVYELCELLQISEAECTFALAPLVKATVLRISAVEESSPVVSLGSCEGLVEKMVDVMPFDFHSLLDRDSTKAHEHRTQQKTAKVNPQRMESQIVHVLKRDGPKTAEELMTFITSQMAPLNVSRGELKRVLEKLIERGQIVRDDIQKKFQFCP